MDKKECGEIIGSLAAFQMGELSTEALSRVRSHLSGCEGCREEEEKLSSAWALLDTLEALPLSPGFRAKFWARARREEVGDVPATRRWVPAMAGLTAVWFLGVTAGLNLFKVNRIESFSATERGLRELTSVYPTHSIAGAFMEGRPTGRKGK